MPPSSSSARPLSKIPAGVWALGFVSLFMDISSEMIHALLPVFLVLSLLGMATGFGSPLSLLAAVLFAPAAWLLGDPAPIVIGGAVVALMVMVKRLEANRLPLPADPAARRLVRWRRLWWDRDVRPDEPWEERGRFDSGGYA